MTNTLVQAQATIKFDEFLAIALTVAFPTGIFCTFPVDAGRMIVVCPTCRPFWVTVTSMATAFGGITREVDSPSGQFTVKLTLP